MRARAVVPLLILTATVSLTGVAVADPPGRASGRRGLVEFYGEANLDAEWYIRADAGPPPTSEDDLAAVGDVSILQDDLFALEPGTTEPRGPQIGASYAHCTFVRVDEAPFSTLLAEALCHGTLTLPRGTLAWQAFVTIDRDNPRDDVLIITGGTGAYARTGGDVTLRTLPAEGDTEAYIYEIRLERR